MTVFIFGSALVDATDSVLMLGAYGRALATAMRNPCYNMTFVPVAVIFDGAETFGLRQSQRNLF